jgi:peptidoglycan/xylan/chitin deacetylase (PgdA/CDA1 family)
MNRSGAYAKVSPELFKKQMNFLKKNNYKVISLEEYCVLVKNNTPLPKKIVIITFDDGFKDNLEAFAVLRELNYPATVFLIVNKIDQPGYLTRKDIGDILKNTKITIGAHTLSEAYLPDLHGKMLKREICLSKQKLKNLFGYKVKTFAYTMGGFSQEVLGEVVNCNYLCACTTNRGFSRKFNRFALRRIKITNRDTDFSFWAKLSGFYNVFKTLKKPY